MYGSSNSINDIYVRAYHNNNFLFCYAKGVLSTQFFYMYSAHFCTVYGLKFIKTQIC